MAILAEKLISAMVNTFSLLSCILHLPHQTWHPHVGGWDQVMVRFLLRILLHVFCCQSGAGVGVPRGDVPLHLYPSLGRGTLNLARLRATAVVLALAEMVFYRLTISCPTYGPYQIYKSAELIPVKVNPPSRPLE